MNENDEKIRARIAHLMAMGNDPRTNQFEAEAALRQAAKMMAQYAIDAASLEGTANANKFEWSECFVMPDGMRPSTSMPGWFGSLAVTVARFTDCVVIGMRDPVLGRVVRFQGEANDVAFAGWLCSNLRNNVRKEASRFAGSRAERETFRIAMVGRIDERAKAFKAEQKAATAASGSHALAVIDRKIAERDARFGAFRCRTVRRGYGSAFANGAGREAGDRVGFGRPVACGGHAALERF